MMCTWKIFKCSTPEQYSQWLTVIDMCLTCVEVCLHAGFWIAQETGRSYTDVVFLTTLQRCNATASSRGHACCDHAIQAHCVGRIVIRSVRYAPGECSDVGKTVHRSGDSSGGTWICRRTQVKLITPLHTFQILVFDQLVAFNTKSSTIIILGVPKDGQI